MTYSFFMRNLYRLWALVMHIDLDILTWEDMGKIYKLSSCKHEHYMTKSVK